MSEPTERQIIDTLEEIRDGQREIIVLLKAQAEFAEAQARRAQARVEESVQLQRIGLQRQRSITLLAVLGISACIAAIAYLVLRYF